LKLTQKYEGRFRDTSKERIVKLVSAQAKSGFAIRTTSSHGRSIDHGKRRLSVISVPCSKAILDLFKKGPNFVQSDGLTNPRRYKRLLEADKRHGRTC